MDCFNCGCSILRESAFCNYCGAKQLIVKIAGYNKTIRRLPRTTRTHKHTIWHKHGIYKGQTFSACGKDRKEVVSKAKVLLAWIDSEALNNEEPSIYEWRRK